VTSPQIHPGEPVVVDRYNTYARINHWITAVSLVLLAVSGLAFFHPSLYFLSGLFGGGSNGRALHPWIGVVLFVSFFALFARFWRDNLFVKEDWTWTVRIRDVITAHEERLPELGKYNAGQKFVFWAMSALIIVMIITGVIIWDEYFITFTTIEVKRVAVLVHAAAAIVAIMIWIVHVYAGVWVQGSLGAMTSGQVTGGWAWKHHRKWLKQLVGGKIDEDMRPPLTKT
jgi:formate dehydrogenase subunit gamma